MSGWRDSIRAAVLSVGGSGYAPFASGSWGSLAAVGLFVIAHGAVSAFGGGSAAREIVVVAGIVAACWAAVAWGDWAVQKWSSSDPKRFVLDEFAGQWVALLLLPGLDGGWLPFFVVCGGQFFLFRVFDVLKPPPARQLERLPGGWGILLDDVAAGLMANVLGQVLWRWTPAGAWLASL